MIGKRLVWLPSWSPIYHFFDYISLLTASDSIPQCYIFKVRNSIRNKFEIPTSSLKKLEAKKRTGASVSRTFFFFFRFWPLSRGQKRLFSWRNNSLSGLGLVTVGGFNQFSILHTWLHDLAKYISRIQITTISLGECTEIRNQILTPSPDINHDGYLAVSISARHILARASHIRRCFNHQLSARLIKTWKRRTCRGQRERRRGFCLLDSRTQFTATQSKLITL